MGKQMVSVDEFMFSADVKKPSAFDVENVSFCEPVNSASLSMDDAESLAAKLSDMPNAA